MRFWLVFLSALCVVAQNKPPASAVHPVTENLHGTAVTDPYRWLEDQESPETRAWIDAQMKYTRAALSEIGRSVGRKSHSTVVSAEQKVSAWLTAGKQVPLGRGNCALEDAVRRVEMKMRLA